MPDAFDPASSGDPERDASNLERRFEDALHLRDAIGQFVPSEAATDPAALTRRYLSAGCPFGTSATGVSLWIDFCLAGRTATTAN